ncbi:AAA family ATPase [Streptomyces griseocarneus]|uniref:AAA family ATPase n=1 Tax=Streptomyces griseocarneus TaxID=51201 RepID=UPI00167E25B6|nr:MoxR family ATPase [Streptomyces griseocarneus]MBZ6475767.1 MoxR family ATPase [Streptomyces griseocarneus]GHG50886.1 ATP-binding protein [Streptomyces griseocarneus]
MTSQRRAPGHEGSTEGPELHYTKEFDPQVHERSPAAGGTPDGAPPADADGAAGTERYAADDEVYVFDDPDLVLALNVALKTGRPLLLFGPPGSGKSSLAPNVARILGWPYYAHVVTARTEPEDLLWRFDALKRLNDAQAHTLDDDIATYYTKGPLWRAFEHGSSGRRSVVLIDEIDKADPDLPNSLLGPLGSLSFPVPWNAGEESGTVGLVAVQEEHAPLVVITTNDERELPRPFLRRCIVFKLSPPTRNHLLSVARGHLGDRYDEDLAELVADHILTLRAGLEDRAAGPGTAEYLDALKASQQLRILPGSAAWRVLESVALRKGRAGAEPGT